MRTFLGLALVIALTVGLFAWRQSAHEPGLPLAVPAGDREIAWIQPATSVGAWERFVTGVLRVHHDWAAVSVDDSRAFPEQTTAVPEVVISLQNATGNLRIRWYKISKDASVSNLVTRLAHRDPAPLCVLGGGSSDRAFDLARAMNDQLTWAGERPTLFFTTATASTIGDPSEPQPLNLMDVYPGRSFRMCFTNAQIASAVVDFVWSQPDLRPTGDPSPVLGLIGATSVETALTNLALQGDESSPIVSALEWDDDPYSVDLSRQFHAVLHEPQWGRVLVRETRGIPFSVGGQYDPNPWEAEAAEHLLSSLKYAPFERQLLVLPTVVAPARRVLRSITSALPLVGRNLVAVTGDSISLNNIYRDADIGWDTRALAVPLVSFAHQNPVAWDEPSIDEELPQSPPRDDEHPPPDRNSPSFLSPPTNTDEALQHRDMMQLIIEAAYRVQSKTLPSTMANSDEFIRQLRTYRSGMFAANGDRIGGQGEYILCLRPQFATGGGSVTQVLPTATLDVWTRQPNAIDPQRKSRWVRVKRLILNHDRDRTAKN
ncbi:MAG: hypothetical protein ACJ8C4_20895 [Gemmataceae bacterium]